MTADAQPTLPGLAPPAPAAGRLERAVHAAVAGAGSLTPLELARVELCLELARVMQSKVTSRKTSTYSHDAKLLAELLGFIGDGAEQGTAVDAELRATIEAWNARELERRSA